MIKRYSQFIIYLFTVLIFMTRYAQEKPTEFQLLKGSYLGKKPPGLIPEKFPFDFLPGNYAHHSAPVFTPDGQEVYFSGMDFNAKFSEKIFVMKMIDGQWTPPQIASFSGLYFDGSPCIAPDGKRLYYSSARQFNNNARNEDGDRNIWYVEKTEDGWSNPKPANFNTPKWENGSDISKKGNLFYESDGDIYSVEVYPNGFSQPEKLSDAINSEYTELHPCISPDESFIIFYSGRPGGFGERGGDLYISFKKNNGSWKQAKNLGENFNKGHLSTSFPRLSPEGKYLFFLKLVAVPWRAEVNWVDVKIILELKKTHINLK